MALGEGIVTERPDELYGEPPYDEFGADPAFEAADILVESFQRIVLGAGQTAVDGVEEVVLHFATGEHAQDHTLPPTQRKLVLKSFFGRDISEDLAEGSTSPTGETLTEDRLTPYEEMILSQFRQADFN